MTKTTVYYPVPPGAGSSTAGAIRVNGTLYFVLKDKLGSADVVTDASGATVGEARYYPFGETRLTTGTMQTDQLFTGQREMAGLGIYHYGARFYSPKLGRFLSADTIVPNMFNPQAFNRYSYVYNNPLRYGDPSGNIPIDCWNDPSYCSNTTTLPTSPYPSAPPPPPPPDDPDDDSGGGGDSVVSAVPEGPICHEIDSCSEPLPLIQVPISTTQNPIDSDAGSSVGVIFNYNMYGEPESYQIIYNAPDSTSTYEWDWGANSSISDWNQFLIPAAVRLVQAGVQRLTGATVCPACVPAITGYMVLDLTNQSILVQAYPQTDPPTLMLTPEQQSQLQDSFNPFPDSLIQEP